MHKSNIQNLQSKNTGMTLPEVAIVAAILLVILIPIVDLFAKSTQMLYVGEQETTAQKEISTAMYRIGQDIQKTLYFGSISSTYFVCTTYSDNGYGLSTVHYYRATDSTIRRVSPFTGTLNSGGIPIAKYVTGFNCIYRCDYNYNTTFNSSSVAAVFVRISVAIPGSTYSYLTAESSWWSRNIRTL
ncbi:MAG: hypothetical protein N3A72_11270 [bacterium]|nr:hypothetical protein [bacterium]